MGGVWTAVEIAGKRADVYEPPAVRPGAHEALLLGHAQAKILEYFLGIVRVPDQGAQVLAHGLRITGNKPSRIEENRPFG